MTPFYHRELNNSLVSWPSIPEYIETFHSGGEKNSPCVELFAPRSVDCLDLKLVMLSGKRYCCLALQNVFFGEAESGRSEGRNLQNMAAQTIRKDNQLCRCKEKSVFVILR